MAVDMFLSITDLTDEKGAPRPGTVVIDSVAYVQISDFSFSAASSSAEGGAGADKAQVEFSPLTVVLPVDFLTPLLFQAVATGAVHPQAVLIVRSSGPYPPVTTQQYNFDEVAVRSLSVAGSPGGEQQTVSLAYGALQITFTPVDAQGKTGTPTTGGFNLATGTVS
jgi:type VI protein secretion system component Hcp